LSLTSLIRSRNAIVFLDILASDDRPMLSAVTIYDKMLIVGARRAAKT
jgi:hypothetical protein